MTQRGKFLSLTMVNWNGFFARTFDIDNLVTTLSGGNGAGKSTTMAAFITALIPDQSLLHFRNTTEAGSSSASRDKGLHGKLKPGVCYALLDVMNSQQQRILFGVRLQQIAGREKKVDIKPFILQNLAMDTKITALFVEAITDNQVRVRQLNEVKEQIAKESKIQYKSFTSITDYHSILFDLGVLPKKLRNTADRAKFYRLIEASLYGGISSAITKSLRDYLLPQNGGVKKAFQDMEAALRENRATLNAIHLTQRDRDLFKHLISESTNYAASDYMRHINERRATLEKSLSLRNQLIETNSELLQLKKSFKQMTTEQHQLIESQIELENEQQAAVKHLQLVQAAVIHKEKISRYQDDLHELLSRLEEQALVVEEAQAQLDATEGELILNEEEADSLKTQLSDYQQALDIQQKQALQYQQALVALEKAQQLTALPSLDLEHAQQLEQAFKVEEENRTQELLAIKHKFDLARAANKQFERALSLIASIDPKVKRADALIKAQELLEQGREFRYVAKEVSNFDETLKVFEGKIKRHQQAIQLAERYQHEFHIKLATAEQLEQEENRQQELLEEASEQLSFTQEKRRDLLAQEASMEKDKLSYQQAAPEWLLAQAALEKLGLQSDETLDSRQTVIDAMQKMANKEREALFTRDELASKKLRLESEIERLNFPSGNEDPHLQALAQELGGTLLAEIYEDIALSDAAYFSALYGPARHAIVVPDLKDIEHKLASLESSPDDLYIIEGDAGGFDENVYQVIELENAVCVHLNERQLRYSRFPKMPLFGRAAREHYLEKLREEYNELQEYYAKASFDAQKFQRITQAFNDFIAKHLHIAFAEDPEEALKELTEKKSKIQREIRKIAEQENHFRALLASTKQALVLLRNMHSSIASLQEESLEQGYRVAQERRERAHKAQAFLFAHDKALVELESLLSILEVDPKEFDSLQQAFQLKDSELQHLKKKIFALSDLLERRQHFSFRDAVELLDKSSELREQLKAKLVLVEEKKSKSREHVKLKRDQHNTSFRTFSSLKSTHQAKQETLQEFLREFNEFGIQVNSEDAGKAEAELKSLNEKLRLGHQRKAELDKSLAVLELEMKNLLGSLKKRSKDYKELRSLVIKTKRNWAGVLKIARANQVDKLLNRRELAYIPANELRSLSDKSLGALRLAVADNEVLRDALRFSEDTSRPERKVLFYVAVYQHLRERIRQDIIQTDDPIDAIEEMDVELARLTHELTQREKRLLLSSESVANIIRKTIYREQNRIRLLNQGLSNISFGQVKGVRLTIAIRDTHLQLLMGLAEKADQHQDLFNDSKLTFSEAMAKVYQRVNPHVDRGQRSLQTLGEELLDYRNYLDLSIEVNRSTDGWLQAESGALSTGEAIGTGQAILLMVVQSWEEESRRFRAKNMIPCRLLFLDEAARLDAKSISTLFELCHRLDMQLLIAAPENISPEQGTTYKLVRKIFNDKEHVHVVGLRGFASLNKRDEVQEELSIIF